MRTCSAVAGGGTGFGSGDGDTEMGSGEWIVRVSTLMGSKGPPGMRSSTMITSAAVMVGDPGRVEAGDSLERLIDALDMGRSSER